MHFRDDVEYFSSLSLANYTLAGIGSELWMKILSCFMQAEVYRGIFLGKWIGVKNNTAETK